MTKVELELRVQELEKELKEQAIEKSLFEDFKGQNKAKTEEIYRVTQELKKLKQKKEEDDKRFKTLTDKFNHLASLFDNYIKTFDDTVAINDLFSRNIKRAQELINIKIKAFNGREE
jgi:uncharacterized damage-inducible protein DinB